MVVEVQEGDSGQTVNILDECGTPYLCRGTQGTLPMVIIDKREGSQGVAHMTAIEATGLATLLEGTEDKEKISKRAINILQTAGKVQAVAILKNNFFCPEV